MVDFQIRTAPLPEDFSGNFQKLYEAIVDRLEFTADKTPFVIGGDMPVTNQGPWLKGGVEWWVWSEDDNTYVPLDVSQSIETQEIFVGATPPDTTVERFPKIWLKTVGVQVLGIYYWFGSEAGWITISPELQPGVITNLMLQNDSLTTEKFATNSVTIAKFAPNIPLSKLPRGGFSRFLRTTTVPDLEWQPLVSEFSADFTTGLKQIITVPHGLPKTPNIVRVTLKCVSGDLAHGYNPFDEIDMAMGFNTQVDDPSFGPETVNSFFKATATDIVIYLHQRPRIFVAGGSWATFEPEPSAWALHIYAAAG